MIELIETARYGFLEARERHQVVRELAAAVSHKRKTFDYLEDTWLALTGQNTKPTTISDAIKWTVPDDVVPLLRQYNGIPAVFALEAIVYYIESGNVDLKDDFQVRNAVKAGWKRFEERRQMANKVEEGFGCSKDSGWHTLRETFGNPDVVKKMERIAVLAGQMFKAFKYQQFATPDNSPQNVDGTETGGDPDRLLASEMAMLADGDTQDLAAMKVMEKQALQFKMSGQSPKTRGPMVIAVDESGSMHDAMTGYAGRNSWAKACAIALIRIAWQEDREVRVVHFDQGSYTRKLPKNDQKQMWEMAHSFLSGGTGIGGALRAALHQVGDLAKDGYEGADIVLITDGEDRDYQTMTEVIDEMDKQQIRMWTVAIGHCMRDDLPCRTRAAKFIFASDSMLTDPNATATLAQGLDAAAKNNKQRN